MQEAEFWKQRIDRENLYAASLRPAPPSELGSGLSSKVSSRASSITRTKMEHLESMLIEERLKRKQLEQRLSELEQTIEK